ncbi:MAG: hypothetical protein KAW88_10035 [Candidatus Cloacimonetes bacterium]|nr:hypothetical protein [Candidatus Cloacimonadota bacterium]
MKKKLFVFPALFCLLLLITGCTEVEDDYTSYFITIVNDSSVNITDISISMIGLDTVVQINDLIPEEISQRFKFQLPDRPSGCVQISYGDYHGSYLQNEIEKIVFIPIPDINILVHINDDGYTIEVADN